MSHQPELDALIVRNIGDIGAAANRVKNAIDPRLWEEAGRIVTVAAAEMGWIGHAAADPSDETVWLSHPDWMEAGGDPEDPPFYIGLDERVEPGVSAEWSWLAAFTGAWPARATAGLFVGDERLKQGAWKKLLRGNTELVNSLVARGFRYDGQSGELYVPFLIDAEKLAVAFEEDVFETALQPLTAALMTINAAHAELTALCRLSVE